MEKFLSKTSLPSLALLFRRLKTGGTSSNFLWRVMLGSALALAVAVGILAWFLYGKVTTEPGIPPSPKHNQVELSIDELRAVIGVYQKKEEEFRLLHSSPPSAPLLNQGSGVSVPMNLEQETEQVLPL